MAEARGKKEDGRLKEAYRAAYEGGTAFSSAKQLQAVLTSGEIKLKPKTQNIAGLQIADLLAHPVKQEILAEEGRIVAADTFGQSICEAVRTKFNRHLCDGQIAGYGKVFIPKQE